MQAWLIIAISVGGGVIAIGIIVALICFYKRRDAFSDDQQAKLLDESTQKGGRKQSGEYGAEGKNPGAFSRCFLDANGIARVNRWLDEVIKNRGESETLTVEYSPSDTASASSFLVPVSGEFSGATPITPRSAQMSGRISSLGSEGAA